MGGAGLGVVFFGIVDNDVINCFSVGEIVDGFGFFFGLRIVVADHFERTVGTADGAFDYVVGLGVVVFG